MRLYEIYWYNEDGGRQPWLTDGSAFPADAYERGVFTRIAPFVQERTKLLPRQARK